ncbi:MAG: hypothetical protein ACKPKO_06415, partial [Candidatus Fonsibacter sp.]
VIMVSSQQPVQPPVPPPGAPPPGSLFQRDRVPLPGQRLEFPERFRRPSPAQFNIASTDGVGISGLTDAENDFMRLPRRGTSVPAHPPVSPSVPGGVNQYPQLLIPPDVRPITPTRTQRGRSRNHKGHKTISICNHLNKNRNLNN